MKIRLPKIHLSESTRRALRTLYQGVVALVTVVPLFLSALPSGSPLAVKLSGVVALIAVVTKALNTLEERGLIPAWLKDAPVAPATNVAPGGDLP